MAELAAQSKEEKRSRFRSHRADTYFRFVKRVGLRMGLLDEAEGDIDEDDHAGQSTIRQMIEKVVEMATKDKEIFLNQFPELDLKHYLTLINAPAVRILRSGTVMMATDN